MIVAAIRADRTGFILRVRCKEDQFSGLLHRHGMQQDLVEHGKNGRVHADA